MTNSPQFDKDALIDDLAALYPDVSREMASEVFDGLVARGVSPADIRRSVEDTILFVPRILLPAADGDIGPAAMRMQKGDAGMIIQAPQFDPLVKSTWGDGSLAQQWQTDLVVDLGYQPINNMFAIAINGVHVVGDRVVVTEVITRDDGSMIRAADGSQQTREVWHDLPTGWPR